MLFNKSIQQQQKIFRLVVEHESYESSPLEKQLKHAKRPTCTSRRSGFQVVTVARNKRRKMAYTQDGTVGEV